MFIINNLNIYILVPFLIIFIIQTFGIFFYKKFFFKTNFFLANLIIILLSVTLISNTTQIILILDEKFFLKYRDVIKIFLISTIITVFIYSLIKKKNEIIFYFSKFKFNILERKIYLYISIIFFSSIGIISDADSIIYNSKISKIILDGFSISYFIDNIHISLLGIIEIFNIYQEILNVPNLNRLLNIYFLINFLMFVATFSNNFKNQKLFFLSVLSIPVFAIIFNHEKTFFMPLIVQFSIFIFLLMKKQILSEEKFLITAAIISSSLFKLSFLISGFVLFIFLILKIFNDKKKFVSIKIVLFCILIFALPHLIFKYYYFGNPFNPFLNFFFKSIYNENININFSIYLKNWINSGSLNYPLNLFIPGTLSKIHNILGIGVLIIFFIKNLYKKINLQILFFFFLSLIFIILFSQNSPRFYIFPLLILMSLILVNEVKYKKILNIVFLIQFIFTTSVMSLMIPVTISTSWLGSLSEKFRNKYIFRYQINTAINNVIGSNQFIITDLPNYYSKNFDISLMSIFLANNEKDLDNYKKFLNSSDVKYLITIDKKINQIKYLGNEESQISNFIQKCFDKPPLKIFDFEVTNRKIFFKSTNKNKFYLYKINNKCNL